MSWNDWVRGPEIEPSIYAADFANLGAELDRVIDAGTRIFHFDIGDGHFVEPVTIGPIVIESIAALVHARGAVIDCHLMVDNPERHIPQVAKAGGDSTTFHFEATDDAAAAAIEAGVDLVLCMTIHPGYSGQELLDGSLERVARLRELLPPAIHVQV